MKRLRIFFTRHRLAEKHYHNTKEHRDFDAQMEPLKAYRLMLEEHGSVLDSTKEVEFFVGQKVKIAPTMYITIHSHTLVEADRKPVVLESERVIEQDLFSPMDLKNALGRRPETGLMYDRRKR